MISIADYQSAIRTAVQAVFDEFSPQQDGLFYFGYREDANRLTEGKFPTVIAEWPKWALMDSDNSKGSLIEQKFLIGQIIKGEKSVYILIDKLQDIALKILEKLQTSTAFRVEDLNRPIQLDILPKGLTPDGSSWIMFTVRLRVWDCTGGFIEEG